jgi:hypothetical protein
MQPRPFPDGALKDADLMSERKIFQLQRSA